MTDFNKVFLDTAPIIYFLEKSDLYFETMKGAFQELINQEAEIYTSAITYEEYEVGPKKNGNQLLIRNFENFIEELDIKVINIDRMIAAEAASIRAAYPGYKAMDALQIAAAKSSGCDLFLTNDKQLRQTEEIKCITVDDLDQSKQEQ